MAPVRRPKLLLIVLVGSFQSTLLADDTQWASEMLLRHPPSAFLVEETPDASQLAKSLQKTEWTASRAQRHRIMDSSQELWRLTYRDDDEPRTATEQTFRLAMRARWLQLNLEYQSFLEAPPKSNGTAEDRGKSRPNRETHAVRVMTQYQKLMGYLWYEPNPSEKRLKFVTFDSSGEDASEWQEVKPFLDMVYHDISKALPKESKSAQQIVRGTYFDAVAPSWDGGVNKSIRDTVGATFEDLQNLGKEAVAAKVQAAVVMRRFYGVTPQATRDTFTQEENENTGLTRIALYKEVEALFPNDESDDWKQATNLIREVSSGGVGGGVVSDYLALNLSIDENGHINVPLDRVGRKRDLKPDGDDGLVAQIRNSDVVSKVEQPDKSVLESVNFETAQHFPEEPRAATKKAEEKEATPPVSFLKLLDEAYGRVDASSGDPDAATRYASLRKLMNQANSQGGDLETAIKRWSSHSQPANENLDTLLAYEPLASGSQKIPDPVGDDKFANAPPPSRYERTWFSKVGGDHALTFDIESSNELVEASKIPDIKLIPSYSTQLDVVVRQLAASQLLIGANDSNKNSTEFIKKNAAEVLLSRRAVVLDEPLDETLKQQTFLSLLQKIWDTYLSGSRDGSSFIRDETVKWLHARINVDGSRLLATLLVPPTTAEDASQLQEPADAKNDGSAE